jgi:hypothetical protein
VRIASEIRALRFFMPISLFSIAGILVGFYDRVKAAADKNAGAPFRPTTGRRFMEVLLGSALYTLLKLGSGAPSVETLG